MPVCSIRQIWIVVGRILAVSLLSIRSILLCDDLVIVSAQCFVDMLRGFIQNRQTTDV
jgi:cell shape-determining protein MreC